MTGRPFRCQLAVQVSLAVEVAERSPSFRPTSRCRSCHKRHGVGEVRLLAPSPSRWWRPFGRVSKEGIFTRRDGLLVSRPSYGNQSSRVRRGFMGRERAISRALFSPPRRRRGARGQRRAPRARIEGIERVRFEPRARANGNGGGEEEGRVVTRMEVGWTVTRGSPSTAACSEPRARCR